MQSVWNSRPAAPVAHFGRGVVNHLDSLGRPGTGVGIRQIPADDLDPQCLQERGGATGANQGPNPPTTRDELFGDVAPEETRSPRHQVRFGHSGPFPSRNDDDSKSPRNPFHYGGPLHSTRSPRTEGAFSPSGARNPLLYCCAKQTSSFKQLGCSNDEVTGKNPLSTGQFLGLLDQTEELGRGSPTDLCRVRWRPVPPPRDRSTFLYKGTHEAASQTPPRPRRSLKSSEARAYSVPSSLTRIRAVGSDLRRDACTGASPAAARCAAPCGGSAF